MRRILFPAAIALLATAIPNPASAQAITQIVDCAKGQTIMAAINRADDRKPLVIVVRGTCTESVVINRDWVTLQGDPIAGDSIVAPSRNRGVYAIEVTGTSNAVNGLTVKGGYHCIFANPQSRVTVSDSTIQDCASGGFFIYSGAAHITNSIIETSGSGVQVNYGGLVTIAGSQVRDNTANGINVSRNSVASVSDSTISDNGAVGISMDQGGQATLTRNMISGNKQQGVAISFGANANLSANTITTNGTSTTGPSGVWAYSAVLSGSNNHINGNTGGGVSATSSNVWFTGGEIQDNGDNGVIALTGSIVRLDHIDISRNGNNGVSFGVNVTAWVWAANILNNANAGIFIERASKLDLGPVDMTYATGNGSWGLVCGDVESSYRGPLTGPISPGCTDYNN
jgi:parallel beta-helix repeat protein